MKISQNTVVTPNKGILPYLTGVIQRSDLYYRVTSPILLNTKNLIRQGIDKYKDDSVEKQEK